MGKKKKKKEIKDEVCYWEDVLIIMCIFGIFTGMMMTLMGIFVPKDSFLYWDYWLAFGLPNWIFSTVYITRGLTFDTVHDINIALKDYSR